jgi:hypothetical protein
MILANLILTGNDNDFGLDDDGLCLLRLLGKDPCSSECPGCLELSRGASLAQRNAFVQLDLCNPTGRVRSKLLLLVLFAFAFALQGSLACVPTSATDDGLLTIGRGPLGHFGRSAAGSWGSSLDDNYRRRPSIACKMVVRWRGRWKAITLSWSVLMLSSLA